MLAERAGLTNATHVWKIETGAKAMNATAARLAAALRVPEDALTAPQAAAGRNAMTKSEAGRLGVRATLERHGRGHYAAAGRLGGSAVRQSLGAAHLAAIGATGRASRYRDARPLPGLRAARQRAGLSRAALARLAGLDTSYLGTIERGANAMPETRARLAAALGVDGVVLVG